MADVAEALEPFATQTTSGGGDRVRISAGAQRDEPNAFAATTRLPDGAAAAAAKSVPPRDRDAGSTGTTGRRRARRLRREGVRLAVPLVLMGAVIALTVVVLRRPRAGTTLPAGAARPLSTVAEAERSYREAMARWHDGAMVRSRKELTRATELDPTFAAAHLELAIQTSADDPPAAQQAFQRAFDHRAMLVTRDAALLEASEPYVRPKPDLEEWETRMTSMVFQHPRDPELQYYLGRARERLGDDDGAKQAYGAAVRLDGAFVPGLAALANIERNLGHEDEALAATERCLEKSPVATTCTELRYRIFSEGGQCARARDEARGWTQLEQSPAAFGALARGLHAAGAPRPSVEEALARKWAASPDAARAGEELWDRMQLAMIDGELAKAEELARKFETTLPAAADAWDRAQPAHVRVNVLFEMGRAEEAADVARDYLDRVMGWTPYPFAPDQSFGFYEPLYRAGRVKPGELAEQRAKWVEGEKARLTPERAARSAWPMWMLAWGALAETRQEALEALANAPTSGALPLGERRSSTLDFNLGKVYALAGRADDALPRLERAARACTSLEDGMRIVRSAYYLGLAQEAKGDLTAARASYERVLASWPKTDARTPRAARARLDALRAR
jgi:tetratricopeptide (TPR) repeat protein